MATGKRFYWLKLKESFMTSDTVDYFMSQPDGANYVVLYQMLCLKTINTEGRLARQIGEIIIPYDLDKIVRDCKWFSADTVRVAMNLYKSFGLIYEDVDGVLVMADHNNLVGSETDYAERNRRLRKKEQEKLPVHNVFSDVSENVYTDTRDKISDTRDKTIDTRYQISEVSKSDLHTDEKRVYGNYVELTLHEFSSFLDKYGVSEFARRRNAVDKKENVGKDWISLIEGVEDA